MNSADSATRLNAALEGRYRIERELGEGGMATVYLADDLKLERKVALKVLKPELAAVVGAERFLAEIKTTANLTHPNILPLHDSGEADSFLFYVMPWVQGETLREKLDRAHQLPVDEAVRITISVAEALDYAHRQGVIHRDIKPANILLQDGKPLISDFGIALAVGTAGQGRMTETGLSLGTPHYMSPEQATGDLNVGASTDIYALGCVLYEMLVGEPPYTGSTAQAILGKIIAGELASATKQRGAVPANVDAAIRKALERIPADRFAEVSHFAVALGDPGFQHGEGPASASGGGVWNRLSIASTTVAVGLAAVLGGVLLRPLPTPESRVPFRSTIRTAEVSVATTGRMLAMSPDGRRMAAAQSEADGSRALYVRDVRELNWTRLRNTAGAAYPSFSPDGDWIVFQQDSTVAKISVSGGPVMPLATGFEPHWGDGEEIVYGWANRLFLVHEDGGVPTLVFASDTIIPRRAHLLPDGSGVVFGTRTGGDPLMGRVLVARMDGSGVRELVASANDPRYVPTGHLLYGHGDGALMGVPFDLGTLEVIGSRIPLIEPMDVYNGGASQFAVSQNGTLVYLRGSESGMVTPVWVGRDGSEQVIDPDWAPYHGDPDNSSVAISPSGDRLAVAEPYSEGVADLWVKVLDRGPRSRFTFEGSRNRRAVWTVDGEALTFLSNRSGRHAVWVKRADGVEAAALVREEGGDIEGVTATSDGSWLVVRSRTGGSDDVIAVRSGPDSLIVPVAATEFSERAPTLSRDDSWLAYVSNESGRNEVYVRPFPNTSDGRWLASVNGGAEPVWSRSGRELFYRSAANELVSVRVPTDLETEWDRREILFSAAPYLAGNRHPMYDVAADDQRFVMLRRDDTSAAQQVVVLVVNWFEELRERMGSN